MRTMKKGFLVILLICFALIAASCSTNQNHAPTNNTAVTGNGQALTKSATDSGSIGVTYELTKQTYTDRKISIKYPQITNMKDVKKQEIINDIIKTEALYKLRRYSNSDLDNLSMEIDYDIKLQTGNLLSIKYSGLSIFKSSYPNNLFYTTNINMDEGTRLKLNDLVNNDDSFVEKVKKGKFIADSPEITIEMLKLTNSELIKKFNTADSIGNSSTFSYFTNDSLGISIPVIHALGDHVEFELKYQDINNNIKAENKVWTSIFNQKAK
jgi:hypothetical protein